MSKELDYERIYGVGEFMNLPRPRRTYFDYISSESKDISIERKLLDIGYLLLKGYDVRSEIHATYIEHETPTKDDVTFSICLLYGELVSKEPYDILFKFEKSNLDALIDAFFKDLMTYYHLPLDGSSHYLKAPLEIERHELIRDNPWKEVANMYEGNEYLFCPNDKEFICSNDRNLISKFNENAGTDFKFILNVPAYPWVGNPLKARVIALSLNPGYDEREAKLTNLFKHLPAGQFEGYAVHLRDMLELQAYSLLPDDGGKKELTYRDIANIHGSYYWWDRLNNAFVSDDLPIENILRNFAVIQYVGYSSRKFKDFGKHDLLPSQFYTKQLIAHILSHNPDTIFVVTRKISEWKKFLGDIWAKNAERFIFAPNRAQSFSSTVLGNDNYDKVTNLLKQNPII